MVIQKGEDGANELCQIIKSMVIPNFINMETAIKTYDREADCCFPEDGALFGRYVTKKK